MDDYEVRTEFASLNEWHTWCAQHPEIKSRETRSVVLESIQRNGFHDPVSVTKADPSQIIIGTDLREGILYQGINSRLRAVWTETLRIQSEAGICDNDLRVFAPEALTSYALRMRGKYRYFLGSEYMPTERERDAFFPVPHEDLQALSFPDSSFHVVVCNEVLEHVSDLDASLRELSRVLKPEGAMVGTFPFSFAQNSIVRARMGPNGNVEHLTAPEYHGNPVSPERGALVFEIPGWEILDRATLNGFKQARLVLVGSRRCGVLAEAVNGVLIMIAKK